MTNAQRKKIVQLLTVSYNAELETVCNYIANSMHLDGFKAKHIKDALAADITEELGHAQQLAQRIKVLEGRIPGSLELKWTQKSMQPPKDPLDILSVINGVIEAEQGAIDQYQKIIEATDGIDPVTQDLCTTLKGDEEEHRRLFKGFLAEAKASR
ncbi:MAG: rubrerythrin [Phycisphaeraceae bacterium]|nr:rubrerythrin [Phycisphaeraceae bacterium]